MDLKLSHQALLAVVGYLLVAVAIFVPVKQADQKQQNEYRLGDRLAVLFIMLLPMILSVYTINCLVSGSCNMWSWFNSILVFIWSVLIFIVSLYGAFQASKQ